MWNTTLSDRPDLKLTANYTGLVIDPESLSLELAQLRQKTGLVFTGTGEGGGINFYPRVSPAWVRDVTVTVTFKVVNGSWEDGTTADRTLVLTGHEGNMLKLSADQIPAAGNHPKDTNYMAGSWDTVPNTETAITEDVTYTYTYAKKDSSRPSSGGGGGSSVTPVATVVQTDTSNGSYTVSDLFAKSGKTVNITPKANEDYIVDAVTVTDKSGGSVPVTANSDGTYSFTMPAANLLPVTTSVTFRQAAETTPPSGSDESPVDMSFVDVSGDDYYSEAVAWAVDKGITTGTDETHFSPNVPSTRAQMVSFLWRAAGSPEASVSEMPFSDVPAGSYYEKAVLWAIEAGVTKGVDETHFAPDDTVTRAQVVTFLFRYENGNASGESGFVDVPVDAWYADAVSWAVANDITRGVDDTHFAPDDYCTRAQIVTFLYRDLGQVRSEELLQS